MTGNDPIESFSLKLNGEASKESDIAYRAYVQGKGWTDWASSKKACGSCGFGLGITAVQTKVIGNYEDVSEDNQGSIGSICLKSPNYGEVKYSAKNCGQKTDSAVLGNATPQGTVLKSIDNVKTDINGLNIEKTQEKQGDNLSSLGLKLSGEKANDYNLYYRVYSSDATEKSPGWMNFAKAGKNGEEAQKAGTSGGKGGIMAVQMMMLPKGETPSLFDHSVDTIAYYQNLNS